MTYTTCQNNPPLMRITIKTIIFVLEDPTQMKDAKMFLVDGNSIKIIVGLNIIVDSCVAHCISEIFIKYR